MQLVALQKENKLMQIDKFINFWHHDLTTHYLMGFKLLAGKNSPSCFAETSVGEYTHK